MVLRKNFIKLHLISLRKQRDIYKPLQFFLSKPTIKQTLKLATIHINIEKQNKLLSSSWNLLYQPILIPLYFMFLTSPWASKGTFSVGINQTHRVSL